MSSLSVHVSVRRWRRVARGAGGAVLLAALAGCSVAGTAFDPGVAATVGDDTVTTAEVDRLTTAACGAFGPQLEAQNQVVPLRQIKTTVVQNLALESAARQLGEEYGVEPGETYLDEVGATTGTADLSAAERDAVVLISSADTLVTDILGQIGAQVAAEASSDIDVPGSTPSATSDAAVQLGTAELTRWLQRHDVEVDPQYGIEITDSGAATVDTSLAFAVSDAALAGADDAGDPGAAMALPESQRCGTYSASGGVG